MPQGDKRVYIEAGRENMPVRAPGDFIFLKECAREIQVIIEGQPVTMRRGDKRIVARREPGRMAFEGFDVSNPHDTALAVTFVVGDGDYNSQIVTGEIYVSEDVKTSSIITTSKPVEVTRTISLVELGELGGSTVTAGDFVFGIQVENVNNPDPEISESVPMSLTYWDGVFWGITDRFIRSFDSAGNVLNKFPVSGVSFFTRCCAIIDGIMYFSASSDSGIGDDVYRISLFGGEPLFVFNDERGVYSMVARGKYLYCSALDYYDDEDGSLANYVSRYDTEGGGSEVLLISPTAMALMFYDEEQDVFFATVDSPVSCTVLDAETLDVLGVEEIVINYHKFAFSRKDNIFVSSVMIDQGAYGYLGRVFKTKDYRAKISSQVPGQPATLREAYLGPEFVFFPRAGGTVMRGPIIEAFLTVVGDFKIPDNYLDYITRLEYFDGRFYIDKKSGTASFAYVEYADIGEVLMGTDVTVGLLPELISDAV